MPDPGVFIVGKGGGKIQFSPFVGHFIVGNTGDGSEGTGQPTRKWAIAPLWAGGGKSDSSGGSDQQDKAGQPGTFFVGVGGSSFAKKGLFGPMPHGFGR